VAVVRYIVPDVDVAVGFYGEVLGFDLQERYGPFVAVVARGDLTVWLSGPRSSAGQALPDGTQPEPGGWNRLVLQVEDVQAEMSRLSGSNVEFIGEPVEGPVGTWALFRDPSGNLVELFQPRS
jgi:catechol 2,3-dioxygenase-like lactoylglutathione lyase family enzyme